MRRLWKWLSWVVDCVRKPNGHTVKPQAKPIRQFIFTIGGKNALVGDSAIVVIAQADVCVECSQALVHLLGLHAPVYWSSVRKALASTAAYLLIMVIVRAVHDTSIPLSKRRVEIFAYISDHGRGRCKPGVEICLSSKILRKDRRQERSDREKECDETLAGEVITLHGTSSRSEERRVGKECRN